ncbi:uncharacterized protein LOC118491524 [Helianthus annuus]|uniref:uncharacterized protein LOC118491524 n=1 Tax=Helianthus annuus TaxID=4232 RepID=UPI00165330C1|nr:uncharacterized protein LOC118491524 [Helianthus annuus]
MVGSEIEAYVKRSYELADMCPNLSRPMRRRIELFIKGLPPRVKGLVTAANLNNLTQIVRLAHKIVDQEVESNSLPPRVSATATAATTATTPPLTANRNGTTLTKQPVSANLRKGQTTTTTTAVCEKVGHEAKDCRAPQPKQQQQQNQPYQRQQRQQPHQSQGFKKGCYQCGDEGHFKRDCPQLNQNANDNNRQNNNNAGNNNGNNGGNGARGRVFTIGAGDARNDGNVVTDLVGQVFDIDLLPVTLGSFDIVIGMDWLSKHQAEILCKEKIVRIPLPDGEPLLVQGHHSGAMVGIISAMQAQKSLRKGYPSILALVTDTPSGERKIEDLLVVCEFADVFPEELPGLPPHRQVEFQIELAPGAALIARAPYRLASGELQELSNQLQELLDRGFIRPNDGGRMLDVIKLVVLRKDVHEQKFSTPMNEVNPVMVRTHEGAGRSGPRIIGLCNEIKREGKTSETVRIITTLGNSGMEMGRDNNGSGDKAT